MDQQTNQPENRQPSQLYQNNIAGLRGFFAGPFGPILKSLLSEARVKFQAEARTVELTYKGQTQSIPFEAIEKLVNEGQFW